MTTQAKDRTIQVSRQFDAPKDLVYDAFTAPEKIGQWWGPNGFTTTTKSMEFKEGGEWIFTMHGPDGTDYPNRITYTKINRPDLIMYDHAGNRPDEEVHFHQTITFEEVNGQTKVTLNLLFPTLKAKENAAEFGAIEGGKQTLARLGEFVKNQ
ncbi:SRPBCC family protein [Rhodohalobacter sp. 614A]|uniref:SRPBCC family protein n=1 Tax=Rhodohalobacter sp. 614A TaxID=2908649 RepID=UPI001F27A484|nr:SRPBCC family protein [Rhodohalobacter sp. 614A]